MAQGPGSSRRNIHSNIFEFFCRPPTQVEGSNFRLGTRFLEHHPVTSPPTNQKKVTHPAALTSNFAYENFSPKTITEFGLFEQKPPGLFAWPCKKSFSAPNCDVSVCLASLCVGHMNFSSVTKAKQKVST